MGKKRTKTVYALSIDFDGGDGADLFQITGRYWKKNMEHIQNNVPALLFASDPPPKVEIVKLTKNQWKRAVQIGRKRMNG